MSHFIKVPLALSLSDIALIERFLSGKSYTKFRYTIRHNDKTYRATSAAQLHDLMELLRCNKFTSVEMRAEHDNTIISVDLFIMAHVSLINPTEEAEQDAELIKNYLYYKGSNAITRFLEWEKEWHFYLFQISLSLSVFALTVFLDIPVFGERSILGGALMTVIAAVVSVIIGTFNSLNTTVVLKKTLWQKILSASGYIGPIISGLAPLILGKTWSVLRSLLFL